MSGLSEAKRRAMATLMGLAPEEVLEAIETRFQQSGGLLATDVVSLARTARMERVVLRHVFAPVLAFAGPRHDGVISPRFNRAVFKNVWTEIARRRPELTENLAAVVRREAEAIAPAGLADGLCAEAASVVRSCDPQALGLANEAAADDLAAYLDLAPIARPALERLPHWLGRLDGEQLTSLRLAFKDADAVHEDGRSRMMEILLSHLPKAGEVLRLVAALTEQASADFIDGTEMASFARRLLDHVEMLAARVRLDNPSLSQQQASIAIEDLSRVAEILGEFDLCFPGPQGGDWTRRLLIVRRQLTDQLESAFRSMPRAVDKALPLASQRLAGRMSRLAPDLSANAGSPAVIRARSMLSILAGTRSAAADLGCEGARRTAAEAVSERIDSYAEEALKMLHEGNVDDAARALELIEVSAEFLALSRNEEAGTLIRRRAAVAIIDDVGPDNAAA